MTARPSPALLAALPAAPLTTLLGVLLRPSTPDSVGGTLDVIAANQGRWLAAAVLSVAGQLLFVPAGIALARLLRSAGSRAGAIGGALLVTTGALHVGVLGYTMAQIPLAEAGAVAAAEAMFESPAFLVLLLPTLLTVYVGIVLVAVALWRTRLTPRWVPVALVVAPALEFVHDPWGTVATFTVWTAAFAAVALERRASPSAAPAATAGAVA
jgi:hypothetical protein